MPAVLANEYCGTFAGVTVRLAGWGLNENGTHPVDLYEIQQKITSHDECYEQWGGDITSRYLEALAKFHL